MKAWMTKALELLKASLEPPKHELNECDWKAALSPDKKRVKAADLNNKSKKFAEYVPFWA